MSSEGLFEVLGNMLNELKDGHVNLASAHNVSYYDAWYQDYPRNFREDIVEDVYLGKPVPTTALPQASSTRYSRTTSAICVTKVSPRESVMGIWMRYSPTLPHATDLSLMYAATAVVM